MSIGNAIGCLEEELWGVWSGFGLKEKQAKKSISTF